MQEISQFYHRFFKSDNVCTDTRKIKKGDIFIALKGENFNGNEFALKALDNGAVIAVVDNPDLASNENTYLVDNTLLFLQKLASYHRKTLKIHVIGLTGSNGKTTTKELIRDILSKKFRCQATKENLNNHIGVPLTILSFLTETHYAIIEMGANHQGEIKNLCEIALPDSGLITNIGKAHLEGFGSLEGVIKAKAELYDYLVSKSGKVYLNGADNRLKKLIDAYKNKVIYNDTSGLCSGKIIASLPYLSVEISDNMNHIIKISSQFYGDYNLENILAAASIGIDSGISLNEIKSAIEKYKPENNRSQVIQYRSTTIILDCYNANPTSMQLALISFSKLKAKKKLVILGSMKELGRYSEDEHGRLVELVKKHNFTKVIFVGKEYKNFFLSNAQFVDSVDQLMVSFNLREFLDFSILVKGSRANTLEQITSFFVPEKGNLK